MTKDFDVSEAIWRKVKSEYGNMNDYYIPICPDCEKHEQEASDDYIDCKNVFTHQDKNGVMAIWGQCNCYSKEHGVRE